MVSVLVLDTGKKIPCQSVDNTVLLFFRHVVECLQSHEHNGRIGLIGMILFERHDKHKYEPSS